MSSRLRFTSVPILDFSKNGAATPPLTNGRSAISNGKLQPTVDTSAEKAAAPKPEASADAVAQSDAVEDASHQPAAVASADEPEDVGAVHRITKKTNFWFEREAFEIQKNAEHWAQEWALRGLPRHDLARTEPLEPEQVIGKLCGQVFRDWQLRVRTKMQDAIAVVGEQFSSHVSVLRAKVTRLESLKLELDERETRIERIRKETEKDARPVRYAHLISPLGFWLGAIALAVVEFMANFPVFRLLLPMNGALAKVATTSADNVDTDSLWAGARMLLTEWATHIEAVVVAAVAVIVLVVLGKLAGRSVRAWLALSPADYPTATQVIAAHRREFAFKGGASSVGIACVVLFLFFSRGSIGDLATERVKHGAEAVAAAQRRLQNASTAGNDQQIAGENSQLQQAGDVLTQLEDDGRYASTVQKNNVPILLLNIALVLTAAVLGFGVAKADLEDKKSEHPDLVRLREKCLELQAEQIVVDHDARTALAQANMAGSRVSHLLGSHPLRGWESKVERLESMIPRFRGENARLRGLDTASIRAFDASYQLDLPPMKEELELAEPPEFKRLRDELNELSLALARLAPRVTTRKVPEAA